MLVRGASQFSTLKEMIGMDEERLIELLIALHDGLPRQGPGDSASTRRALALCASLPDAPEILDIGCGTGAQTLTLAAATTAALYRAPGCSPSAQPLSLADHSRGCDAP